LVFWVVTPCGIVAARVINVSEKYITFFFRATCPEKMLATSDSKIASWVTTQKTKIKIFNAEATSNMRLVTIG
jgi:hypothetical protein